MQTKKSPHEAGNERTFEADSIESGQLALFELSTCMPSWPTAGTLADRALNLLLDGQVLDHPTFEGLTGSWRLAAVVFELRALNWPIRSRIRPTQPGERGGVAVYLLPARAIAEAVAIRGGRA